MNKDTKDDLEKLETLRDLALCGPEEKREEAHEAYQELRSQLLDHDACQACDDDKITKELSKDQS